MVTARRPRRQSASDRASSRVSIAPATSVRWAVPRTATRTAPPRLNRGVLYRVPEAVLGEHLRRARRERDLGDRELDDLPEHAERRHERVDELDQQGALGVGETAEEPGAQLDVGDPADDPDVPAAAVVVTTKRMAKP